MYMHTEPERNKFESDQKPQDTDFNSNLTYYGVQRMKIILLLHRVEIMLKDTPMSQTKHLHQRKTQSFY